MTPDHGHLDDFPNDEQRTILQSPARLVVVRAGPGSGKTRVFVEALQNRLREWDHPRAGIAALSFTNVAKDEIARRTELNLSPPHFLGTLDAFVWRYIVRPFSHLVGVRRGGAILIPAPLADTVYNPRVALSGRQDVSLFRCYATGGDESAPLFTARPVNRPAELLPPGSAVFTHKKAEWARRGRVTHSDCQYLASAILRDTRHGPTVRGILAARFPVLLVDEAQDTGWFLGRALLALLGDERFSGLVVGDPDQALYEFAGADPRLFDSLDALAGANPLPISVSQRCARRIAAVSTALSQTGRVVRPRDDAQDGHTILVVHDHPNPTALAQGALHDLAQHFQGLTESMLLGRRSRLVRALSPSGLGADYPGTFRLPRWFDSAATSFLAGECQRAAQLVSKVLSEVLFDDETPTRDFLRAHGVAPTAWRRQLYALLLEASKNPPTETWDDWTVRMKDLLNDAARALIPTVPPDVSKRIAAGFKKSPKHGGTNPRQSGTRRTIGPGTQPAIPFSTIHGVKGREFDGVGLIVPKPHATQNPCPSCSWWPSPPGAPEEQRVAFVAASRARNTLVLYIHRDTLTTLRRTHPEFVALFDVLDSPSPEAAPSRTRRRSGA